MARHLARSAAAAASALVLMSSLSSPAVAALVGAIIGHSAWSALKVSQR